MIDFARNHFELFGLPARFAVDAAALERALPRAAARRASGPLRRRPATREQRVALQCVGARQRGVPHAADPVDARPLPARAARRRRARPRPTPRCRSTFLERQLERREAADEARGAPATRRARRAARRGARRRARRSTASSRDALDARRLRRRRARACASCMFLQKLADDIDAMIDGAATPDDGAAADLRARAKRRCRTQRRRAVGIDLGTTNSLVATVRNGLPVVLRRRRRAAAAAVGRPLSASGGVDVGYAAHARSSRAIRATPIVSVKRFMGRGLARPRRRPALSVPLRRRAGHGAASRTRAGRQDAGRGLGRDPEGAARARRERARRRDRRRGGHGAGVFRRRAAPGDQGRRAARRPATCCAC